MDISCCYDGGRILLGIHEEYTEDKLSEWPVVDCHAKHLTIGCLTVMSREPPQLHQLHSQKRLSQKGNIYIFQASIFRCEDASLRESTSSTTGIFW